MAVLIKKVLEGDLIRKLDVRVDWGKVLVFVEEGVEGFKEELKLGRKLGPCMED